MLVLAKPFTMTAATINIPDYMNEALELLTAYFMLQALPSSAEFTNFFFENAPDKDKNAFRQVSPASSATVEVWSEWEKSCKLRTTPAMRSPSRTISSAKSARSSSGSTVFRRSAGRS